MASSNRAGSGASSEASSLTLDGRTVTLTRLNKVLYPASKFTKAQVIDYYVRAAPFILPHLKDRPVTLKRYPDGIQGEAYWDKDAPSFKPEWVKTFPVPRHAGGPDIHYIIIDTRATLAWTANIAALELHPFLHRIPEIGTPTSVVFDLDPGVGAGILQCIEVARLLRNLLDELQLQCFPKVSGSKGVQVYVPLNTPTSYAITQPFARWIAEEIERQRPDLAVAVMPKEKRAGKVFIDWSQNADYKTTAGVYSLRAKRDPPSVSVPVGWHELETALKRKSADSLFFEPQAALERLETMGDLFAPVLLRKQALPAELSRVVQSGNGAEYARQRQEHKRQRQGSGTSEVLPRRSAQGGRRRFVIEKDAASRVQHHLRLEIGGVLKSWAIPKGVPLKPGVRRLAEATEDRKLEDLDFQMTTPKSRHAGLNMIWDAGSYEIIEGNYRKGTLHIGLAGKKVQGEFYLSREVRDGKSAWVLEKVDESTAGAAVDDSVVQTSNRTAVRELLDSLPAMRPEFVEPMQCKPEPKLPEGDEWEYEVKLDGYRALGIKRDGAVSLLSRRNNSLTREFPEIVAGLQGLADGTTLDGEIVALDAAGKLSFNQLQNRRLSREGVRYYAFDLLVFEGKQVMGEALRQRRELLRAALTRTTHPVYLSAPLRASAAQLIAAAREYNLEGIVAKRLDSRYEPGKRSGAWVKVKLNQDQELVIGGYVPAPKRGFDALLVGYYRNSQLIFAGKIRNGFKETGSKERVFERFEGLGTDRCPFDNLPEPANARRGMALTAEAMKLCCWLKPKLVAQVGIREWTTDGHLRHSTFLGLRSDKDPREVVRETTV